MTFLTAFLWGTGLSLGLCVGLVAWAFLRPRISVSTSDWRLQHESNQLALNALLNRNRISEDMVDAVARIANAIELENGIKVD